MKKELKELINRIEEAITNDDFIDISYDIVEEIEEREDSFEAVEPILILMEKNPDFDFGEPGQLVHL